MNRNKLNFFGSKEQYVRKLMRINTIDNHQCDQEQKKKSDQKEGIS